MEPFEDYVRALALVHGFNRPYVIDHAEYVDLKTLDLPPDLRRVGSRGVDRRFLRATAE